MEENIKEALEQGYIDLSTLPSLVAFFFVEEKKGYTQTLH